MNRKKNIRIAVEIALIISLLVIFVLINEQIVQNRKSTFELINDSNRFAYQVENISDNGDYLVIEGWFFELKSIRNIPQEVNENNDFGIVIYDLNSNNIVGNDLTHTKYKGVLCDIEHNTRNDVNNYYGCEYDYSWCGFSARIKKSTLDIKNGEYQIIIKPESEGDYGIDTEAFIDHGDLQYIKPKDNMLLDLKGTDVEEIANKGKCLLSYPEQKICVYQYQKKLYWIIDKNCYQDGEILLQIFKDTTQYDKLPRERKEKGIYWDNVSSSFEVHEITNDIKSGQYRVCEISILEEYSITTLTTEFVYNGIWFGSKLIRPLFLYQ